MADYQAQLDRLDDLGLRRKMRFVEGAQGPRITIEGNDVLLLCSNNYLGLANHPRMREAAAEATLRWGAGAGASRLVSGSMTVHRDLEEQLARFKGSQACLLFGSGYLANLGVIGAMAGQGDVIFSDELNHASIVDGCRLSHADVVIYRHCDVEHLTWQVEQCQRPGGLIVSESVFSMDGDIAPLQGLVDCAQKHGLGLVVDEAHATGTIGAEGRGAVHEAGLADEVQVVVGTLGKALGSYGAFVACSTQIAELLVNRARSFIFSTAPAPAAAAAAIAALEILEERPSLVSTLQANARILRQALLREGLEVPSGPTPIVPVILGSATQATAVSDRALHNGVFAQAIRPPTVPQGTSRLRLTAMASHTESDLRAAARVIAESIHASDPDATRAT